MSIQEEYPPKRFTEVRTECWKLLDQTAPVQWLEGSTDAPAPVLLAAPERGKETMVETKAPAEVVPPKGLEVETPVGTTLSKREVPVWAVVASLLPVAAAAVWHLRKKD